MMQRLVKNLNILYVGKLPPHPGGSAILGFQLLFGFANNGHSVRSIAPITNEQLQNGDTFAVNYPEINITRITVPYFETSPDVPPSDEYRINEGKQIIKVMSQMISNDKPDIIVIGQETFAWHVPDIAVSNSIPSVLLIQGGTTHGILRKTIPNPIALKFLENYKKIDLKIVVAKHLVGTLELSGLNNLKVIQNTIDIHRFYPKPKNSVLLQKLGLRENNIVIAHISNLKLLKRPMDIVDSAVQALQKNPNLIYLIVGDGNCRKSMEEACKSKEISKSFRFTGWVDHELIPDYLNIADIVVMPSEAEALALVYLETQACGRLLLASDIPAAREAVIDRETGVLFKKGNIDDLTSKTLLASNDPELRSYIGKKARESVLNYTADNLVNHYLSTFREVIQNYT